MHRDTERELQARLNHPGETNSDNVLEAGAQLLLTNTQITNENYNTIIFALIEKITHLEEEIVRLRVENG